MYTSCCFSVHSGKRLYGRGSLSVSSISQRPLTKYFMYFSQRKLSFTGPLLSWPRSYLESRMFRVRVNRVYRSWKVSTSGASQRAIIGPHLSLIVINKQLGKISFTALIYASNTMVQRPVKSENDSLELQMFPTIIEKRVVYNELKLSKYHVMSIPPHLK